MHWLHTEYLLKGLYLGLLVLMGVRAATATPPNWQAPLLATLFSFAGLVIGIAVAGYGKLRQGYHVRGRLPAFILFLLLESPTLVYAGILLGTFVGTFWIRSPEHDNERLLAYTVGGGAMLGIVFGALRQGQNRWARFGFSLLLGSTLVTA